MKKQKKNIWGRAVLTVLAAEAAVFLFVLIRSQLLPGKMLAAAAVVLCLFVFLEGVLLWNKRKGAVMAAGAVLALLFFLGTAILGGYLYRTSETLRRISEKSQEVSSISIYLRQDDPAGEVSQLAGYTFGILQVLDREAVDAAIGELEEELGASLHIREYGGVTALAEALVSGEVDAVLLDPVYLELLSEMEGYEDIASKMRILSSRQIVSQVKIAPKGEEQSETADAAGEKKGSEEPVDHIFTVYISGIDSRSEKLAARSRSDVNIIAVVNQKQHRILLVSTPRDYFVPLSISNGVPDKLTHAGIYGVQVSLETLEMLYGVPIDYYIRLNFSGFVDLIDALGGVTVHSDITFDTKNMKGYHFEKGENAVDGAAALAFARERYSYASGDRQRGENQMEVIRAVVKKAVSADILKNYSALLQEAEDCVDTNIPYPLIASLVRGQLFEGEDWEVSTYSVDGTGDRQVPYSMDSSVYVMVPDQETVRHARELLEQARQR